MICSATINGIAIEVKGTPIECFEFFRLMSPVAKKVCDPMARHYGNCGAPECPIIAPDCYDCAYWVGTCRRCGKAK